MNGKHTEQDFINAVRESFDNSVRELDEGTVSRLAAIRARALARPPMAPYHHRPWLLVPAGALVLVCITLVAYKLLLPPSSSPVHGPDEIELLSTLEGMDLYDDIEFYEWLEDRVDII